MMERLQRLAASNSWCHLGGHSQAKSSPVILLDKSFSTAKPFTRSAYCLMLINLCGDGGRGERRRDDVPIADLWS